MNGLDDKSALIFAGSRGIGRATALRLGHEGAAVTVGYAGNEAAADEVVKLIKSAGGDAHKVKANIAERSEVNSAFDDANDQFGKVDIVVNAGAASIFAPHAVLPLEDFRKSVAVNVEGAFNVLQEAANRVSDGGRIIQFSTGGTKMPVQGGGVYSGTKAAGELMALSLAKELGQRQVTVNVISPGVTNTDGLIMPADQIDMLVAQTPMGRLGEPEDIGNVVAFLASADAGWITGQNIQANGGIL